MLYRVSIEGISPIIHNNGAGVDKLLPLSKEIEGITKRKPRTASDEARLRELEAHRSLWLDDNGAPTIAATAIRANVEGAARKSKEGGQVREGMLVTESSFSYDLSRYGASIDELKRTTQFSVPVVQQRQRIIRTRARFDLPWSCVFVLDCDDNLVDVAGLERWLDIGGRRIGLGDWRPERSGVFGRYIRTSIEPA